MAHYLPASREVPDLEDIKAEVEAEAKQINPAIRAAIEKYNANVRDPAKKGSP